MIEILAPAGSREAFVAALESGADAIYLGGHMFGARHFDNYHFLLSLSDYVAHFGLEHHQSNDSRVYEKALVDQSPSLGVVAHEYVHSWNGKYRRPAGLATANFQEPMQGELLWVYEGLTQYLGYVRIITRNKVMDRIAQRLGRHEKDSLPWNEAG